MPLLARALLTPCRCPGAAAAADATLASDGGISAWETPAEHREALRDGIDGLHAACAIVRHDRRRLEPSTAGIVEPGHDAEIAGYPAPMSPCARD